MSKLYDETAMRDIAEQSFGAGIDFEQAQGQDVRDRRFAQYAAFVEAYIATGGLRQDRTRVPQTKKGRFRR